MSLRTTSTLRASASAFALAVGLLAAQQGFAQTVPAEPPPGQGYVRPSRLMEQYDRLQEELAELQAEGRRLQIDPLYCAGRSPGKAEAEAELAAFAQRVAEIRDVTANLKAAMLAAARRSAGAADFAALGFNPTAKGVFDGLDRDLAALSAALKAKQDALARSRVTVCDEDKPRKAGPGDHPTEFVPPKLPPRPYLEQSLEYPHPVPYCFDTEAEKKAWHDELYATWNAIGANSLRASNHVVELSYLAQDALRASNNEYGKPPWQIRQERYDFEVIEREWSDYEKVAEWWRDLNAQGWAVLEKWRAAEVPCKMHFPPPDGPLGEDDPKKTPTGLVDGPVTAPTPPMPPGVSRPTLERVEMIDPPKSFCTEREKRDYILDVWYRVMQAAAHSLAIASEYQASLVAGRNDAKAAGDAKAAAAYQAEIDAWKPILEKANKLAKQLADMRATIDVAPVAACGDGVFKSLDPRAALLESLNAARAESPLANRGAGGDASFDWGLAVLPFDGSEARREVDQRMGEVESRRQLRRETVQPSAPVTPAPPVQTPVVETPTQTAPPVEERPVETPSTVVVDRPPIEETPERQTVPQPPPVERTEAPPLPEIPATRGQATVTVGPIVDVVRPMFPSQPQQAPPPRATEANPPAQSKAAALEAELRRREQPQQVPLDELSALQAATAQRR